MQKNEIVFVAKPTCWVEKIYPGYHKFFNEFYPKLKEYHEVETLELPDIWVRDFLPVQNQKTRQLHQMFFDPRYANYTPQFTALIRQAVHNCFPQAKSHDLRIDGGNMVLNPKCDIVFSFEKQTIFHKSKPKEKQKAEQVLKTALGVDKVVWVPREIGDEICHIDGFMQFLGNILCVTNENALSYWILYDKKFQAIEPFIDKKSLLDLPYEIDENNSLSASGIYVNFLETANAVFVPQYGLWNDEDIFNIIKQCTKKTAIKVDCSKIAEYGGAVHCLTREYNL